MPGLFPDLARTGGFVFLLALRFVPLGLRWLCRRIEGRRFLVGGRRLGSVAVVGCCLLAPALTGAIAITASSAAATPAPAPATAFLSIVVLAACDLRLVAQTGRELGRLVQVVRRRCHILVIGILGRIAVGAALGPVGV